MKKVNLNKGFSLVEIILASALFVLVITAIIGSFIYSRERTMEIANRSRAILIAEESIEALKNIRDDSYYELTDGIYGLSTAGNEWSITTSTDIIDNFFTRTIEIGTIDGGRKAITSTVSWPQPANQTGTFSLVSYITNWRQFAAIPLPEADSLFINIGSATLSVDSKLLTGITLENISATQDITVKQMIVSWTGGNSTSKLKSIDIGATTVWSGNGVSGNLLEITPYLITADNTEDLELNFSKSMSGTTFTLDFIMDDDTTSSTQPFTL
jgi:type II secretory pathway pseudopilin PulG